MPPIKNQVRMGKRIEIKIDKLPKLGKALSMGASQSISFVKNEINMGG